MRGISPDTNKRRIRAAIWIMLRQMMQLEAIKRFGRIKWTKHYVGSCHESFLPQSRTEYRDHRKRPVRVLSLNMVVNAVQ
jgi:hypothetical protein